MGLTVSELACSRAGRPVLSGIGFQLGDGEALVVRGPNGAGKTTLLRALARLLPAAGRIELDGVSAARDPDGYGERLAYVGHLDAIKPQLTVAENLRFWAALFGGNAIGAGLEAFDLEAIADRPAHLLSAGQKRRLGLARLMLAPRRLWLLDEPAVSLDAASVTRLLAAVRAHCAGGGMAVVAAHGALELAPARELRLAPEDAARGRADADPFLAGAWA